MNIIDTLLPALPPWRVGSPVAVVLHQTGETDLDKIIKYYTTNGEKVAPHYMVEVTGSIRRFVPEDHTAYHAGMKDAEARLYRRGWQEWACWLWNDGDPKHMGVPQPRYNAWRDQWLTRGFQSPLSLVTGDHPNGCTIGIECQKPSSKRPFFFEPEQYAALGELVADVTKRHGIPADRAHVLHHFDVNPMRRSTEDGSYDLPASFSYNRLWDEMRGK